MPDLALLIVFQLSNLTPGRSRNGIALASIRPAECIRLGPVRVDVQIAKYQSLTRRSRLVFGAATPSLRSLLNCSLDDLLPSFLQEGGSVQKDVICSASTWGEILGLL